MIVVWQKIVDPFIPFEYGMGLCEAEAIVVCQEIVDPFPPKC